MPREEAVRRCRLLVGWGTDACAKEIGNRAWIIAFDAATLRHERGHVNQYRAGIHGDTHEGWIGGDNSTPVYRPGIDGNQGFR